MVMLVGVRDASAGGAHPIRPLIICAVLRPALADRLGLALAFPLRLTVANRLRLALAFRLRLALAFRLRLALDDAPTPAPNRFKT